MAVRLFADKSRSLQRQRDTETTNNEEKEQRQFFSVSRYPL